MEGPGRCRGVEPNGEENGKTNKEENKHGQFKEEKGTEGNLERTDRWDKRR